MRWILLAAMTTLTLAGCASDRGLRDLSSNSQGPDEFAVLPGRPLDIPATRALPEPTPGGSNLADPNPVGDGVVALGGSEAAAVRGGVPAGDAALVATADRYGTDPQIRATLAAEDAAFRARASRGLFNSGPTRYFTAYARMALDAYAELARFRTLGVEVPSAPPPAN